jgi:HEAT repeat protein
MKTFPRSFAPLVLAMTAATLLFACSKSSTPSANVDVGAQTEQLKSPDVNLRVEAATALAAAGPSAAPAVPALIEALNNDSDPLVRRLSAYALGQIGPAAKEAIPSLTAAMQSGDREMVTSVINAIRAIDPTAMPEGNISNIQTPPAR